MPVIAKLNEVVKIGLDFSGAAPPAVVAGTKTMAQVIMSSAMLLPLGIAAIPIIPFGAPISLIIQLIEYLVNYFFELNAKIIQKMVDLYAQQLTRANAQRAAAEQRLYNDEKKAQIKLRERKKFIETRIPEIQQEMIDLKIYQDEEKAKYTDTVFQYSQKAKNAKDIGDDINAKFWENMISSLEEWLVKILLITIEIMNKKLEMWELEREFKRIVPLCDLNIEKKWIFLEEWADDFEVPVPYYPDLPERPNLPTLPVLPKSKCIPEKAKQMLGKWLTAPMVPPIGLAVGAILECVRAQMAPLPPPIAAKVEAFADGLAARLGMVI